MSVYRLKSENELLKTTARISRDGIPVLTDAVAWPSNRPAAPPAQPATTSTPHSRSGATKYGNVKTGGEASKRQAKRLSELRLMAEAGQIRGLARQPEYVLIPKQTRESGEMIERKMTYIADFQYQEWSATGWRLVVEDAKGYATPGYVQKRKLMLRIHGIEVREV